MTWGYVYGCDWAETPERRNVDENGLPSDPYRPPSPSAFVTHPTETSGTDMTPSDWDAATKDYEAFIAEVKAKLLSSDDEIVEWNRFRGL